LITVDEEVLTLLDEGRMDVRGLLKFEFGGGTYGFIMASSSFDWNGLTYLPGGIIEVSDLPGETGMSAQQFTLTLAASPDDGLTPAVLQTIESEDYRDRPVTLYDAYLHPDTGALISVRPLKRGYLDTISHEDDESGYRLVASCETRALDYTRTNGRVRSPADQARRSPGDRFFEHAATRSNVTVYWGRVKKNAPAQGSSTISDLLGRLGSGS
jgi:hypothetical protein